MQVLRSLSFKLKDAAGNPLATGPFIIHPDCRIVLLFETTKLPQLGCILLNQTPGLMLLLMDMAMLSPMGTMRVQMSGTLPRV